MTGNARTKMAGSAAVLAMLTDPALRDELDGSPPQSVFGWFMPAANRW